MADAANAYTQAISNAVASARSMLGKNEVPNHAELQSYLHDGGQDLDPHKLAWCAAFVSSSLQKAGLPVPTQVVRDSAFGPGAYAPNYLTYGNAVDPKNVQAGDILVANNGAHVGFAEGGVRQGPNGPEAQLLAGNERDPSGQYAPGSYTNPATGAVANRSQVGMVGERWVPLSQYSARRYVPTDDASQPAAAPSASSSTAPSGTTLNSAPAQGSTFETMRNNIAQFESGNNYKSLGPLLRNGDQAVGKYQVMGSNVPSWTQKWLGHSMTPEQFRADPQAQEAVFNGEFGSYLQGHSPADAASMWFTGKPLQQGANLKDVNGTSGSLYASIATKGVDNPNAPGTTINTTTPAGAPPSVAGAPAAPAAPGQPGQAPVGLAGSLPGFQANSPGAKMTAAGLKQLGGGDQGAGGGEEPQAPPLQMAQAHAIGGPMMMGAGGQNTFGQRAAEQSLAQQGYMMQPSLAAFTPAPGQPPVPSTIASQMPGTATGMPSLPGTTLNSPSQLQMALMSGSISPYDMYARNAAAATYGGSLGS